MKVRPMEPHDAAAWVDMQLALWPDATRGEQEESARMFFAGESRYVAAAFIAIDDDGSSLGFLELNLRAYAEGCEASPVPHIEGWYVAAHARRRGVGRALMQAAEAWARANGFSEMTSDTTDDYPDSIPAHAAGGFVVVERLIAMHKRFE